MNSYTKIMPPPHPVDFFDDVEPALTDSYLIKGVLSQGAMSVVYGPSNSGKTFFALDVAFHIANGEAWNGRRVAKAAVLYLAVEGGRGVRNRVAALRRAFGRCNVPLGLRRAGLDLLKSNADLQQVVDLVNESPRPLFRPADRDRHRHAVAGDGGRQ
jgi:AAA domain-containing protein